MKKIFNGLLAVLLLFSGFTFSSCYNMYDTYGEYVKARGIEHFEIPAGETSIDENEFVDCDTLKSITIPNSAEIYNLHPTNNYGVLC